MRNVRAYAARGLIDPPRLEGRTGYYHLGHLQRLQLVREFLDRGYTLAAVEKAGLVEAQCNGWFCRPICTSSPNEQYRPIRAAKQNPDT